MKDLSKLAWNVLKTFKQAHPVSWYETEKPMNHEKTFDAIIKLKEVEIELHRLKNLLELANKTIERQWIGLMDEEISNVIPAYCHNEFELNEFRKLARAVEAKLKEKNT